MRVNTHRAYARHGEIFHQLCEEIGVSHDATHSITEENLEDILILYAYRYKITTLPNFIRGADYSVRHKNATGLPQGSQITATIAALKNLFAHDAAPVRAKAITTADLLSIRQSLDLSVFDNARDWCAYIFALLAMMRISEYTGNDSLKWKHVSIVRTSDPAFVQLIIPFSKTDAQPRRIRLTQQSDALCPIAAFEQYSAIAGHQPPDSPLFTTKRDDRRPVSAGHFIVQLRKRLRAIDQREVSQYSGHSFRRGGATEMTTAAVSDTLIQHQGRWRSDTFRQYVDVDHNTAVLNTATALFDRNRRGNSFTTPAVGNTISVNSTSLSTHSSQSSRQQQQVRDNHANVQTLVASNSRRYAQ